VIEVGLGGNTDVSSSLELDGDANHGDHHR
jgi:hypothetical protein